MKRNAYEEIVIKGLHEREAGLYAPCVCSAEDARKIIDAENDRWIKAGAEPRKFLICCKETYEWFDDDGVFVKSEVCTGVIEKYPAD